MGHHQIGNIFKVFDSTGIFFLHRDLIQEGNYRRLGQVYVSKSAMEMIAKELILNHGHLRSTRRRLLFHFRNTGNRLWGAGAS